MARLNVLAIGAQNRSAATPLSRGFLAMLPLWTGALPVGIAYSVAATEAGFSAFETQLMSVVVFSATTQITLVAIWPDEPALWLMLVTALAFNVQVVLLGLAIRRLTVPGPVERIGMAALLTEGALGVAAALGRLEKSVLAGAGLGMFVAWNLGTALGLLLGRTLPDPGRLGLDLVVPLTFLALLVPLLQAKATWAAALMAAATAMALAPVAPVGIVILAAGIAGGGAGAMVQGSR